MAKIRITAKNNSVVVNGLQCEKGKLSIGVNGDNILVKNLYGKLSDVTINGNSYSTMQEFIDAADELLFENGGGAPGEGVQSVTGDLVSGTSANPIVNLPVDVVKESDLGDMALKDKVAIADIDTSSGATSSSFLRGDGLWTNPNRNFTSLTNVTANRTVQNADLDRNRLMTFNGADLVYTIPYPAGGLSQYGVANILNMGSTALEIAKQSGSVILVSEDDLTRVKAKSQATLTYLGSETWFLSGGLSNT